MSELTHDVQIWSIRNRIFQASWPAYSPRQGGLW